jgi:hypothetical protein
MKERTITIQGKQVSLAYCAATENGFEELSGKSINDIDYHRQRDLTTLGLAAIVAAHSRKGEEPPVDADTINFDATKDELVSLMKTVLELRMEWYGIPKIVADKLEREIKEAGESEGEETPKN